MHCRVFCGIGYTTQTQNIISNIPLFGLSITAGIVIGYFAAYERFANNNNGCVVSVRRTGYYIVKSWHTAFHAAAQLLFIEQHQPPILT